MQPDVFLASQVFPKAGKLTLWSTVKRNVPGSNFARDFYCIFLFSCHLVLSYAFIIANALQFFCKLS